MEGDAAAMETLNYIKSDRTLSQIWSEIEKVNPSQSYFSDFDSRKVTFKVMGVKIEMYFDNEVLFGNDRFYLIQYHPNNKLLKLLFDSF